MGALAAIVFDFDGVIADCRSGTLLAGAERFIRSAATAVPLGIASGAMTHEIEALLDKFGLRDLFTAIIGVDQTVRSKPSPDPFLEALHRITAAGFEIDPGRAVAIDDSLWGLVAAREAGLHCVGVANSEREKKLQPHAAMIVPGLHALTLDMLDTLVRGTGEWPRRHAHNQ
jgi:beta-phosphoglucomutase-like phosphatase (HAD superfamily)